MPFLQDCRIILEASAEIPLLVSDSLTKDKPIVPDCCEADEPFEDAQAETVCLLPWVKPREDQ